MSGCTEPVLMNGKNIDEEDDLEFEEEVLLRYEEDELI